MVNLGEGTLRLAPGSTKNGDGRLVYLTPELRTGIAGQLTRVKSLERALGRAIPWLFPHFKGHARGRRIKSFSRLWKTACRPAGCPGKLKHDLRRSAVREMVNRGIVERVAMKITGHRTRLVFDGYHIVAPTDLQEATLTLSDTSSDRRHTHRHNGGD
jgi:integrase